MLRRYRCRHDIVASILKAIASTGQARISNIASKAGIPIDRARVILRDMEESGLLYYNSATREYSITSRGYEWLGIYEMLESTYKLSPTRSQQ